MDEFRIGAVGSGGSYQGQTPPSPNKRPKAVPPEDQPIPPDEVQLSSAASDTEDETPVTYSPVRPESPR